MEAAKPLMEWLRKNWHPHVTAIVDSEVAELTEGVCTAQRKEWATISENNPSQHLDSY
jgi:hypothetical protein